MCLGVALALVLTLWGFEGDALAAAPGDAPGVSQGEGIQIAQRKKRTRRKRKRKRKKKKEEEPKEEESSAAQPVDNPGGDGALRRSNVMEFDARLVQGETPKAGAVYIFQRAPRRLPQLVRLRQSYLDQIVEPVLGAEKEKRAKAKKAIKKDREPAGTEATKDDKS